MVIQVAQGNGLHFLLLAGNLERLQHGGSSPSSNGSQFAGLVVPGETPVVGEKKMGLAFSFDVMFVITWSITA